MLIFFCALFAVLCVYLLYILGAYGTRWFASPYNTHIDNLKNTVAAGDITDRNGTVLAHTDADGNRRYAGDKAVRRALCHIVGDTYAQTLGAEALYSKYLLSFDLSLSERFKQYRDGTLTHGSDVALCVDAELSRYVYDCMDEYWGAIVVMDYKTGEILASVSQPTFDPERMAAYLSGETSLAGSAMVNRVTMGRYTPGSTFKLVTLLAALRYVEGAEAMTFPCTGPLAFEENTGKYLPALSLPADYTQETSRAEYDREAEFTADEGAAPQIQGQYNVVRDYQNEYHGDITLQEAFARSCNTTFARLAMRAGGARMARTAAELGIGKAYQFQDVILYESSYDPGSSELELAWSGVGQYKDLMTPLYLCMLSGAIANDGVMMEPKLLRSVTTPSGKVTRRVQSSAAATLMERGEARTLQTYMRAAITEGTGQNAAVSGLAVCGKTGTAEISSNKKVKTHAWFTGFILEEEHPLSICIVLEQAGGGGAIAAPIAGKIFKKAVALGY